MNNYLDAKEELLEEMEANEGATIMEDMIKERRDWVTEYRRKNLGKFPDNLEGFHKRFDVETPEEIAAREAAAEAEDDKKGKKKGGAKGGAKGKGGKGKKKKKDEDDGKPAIIKIGPPETVQKFETFYMTYNDTWATRDEAENYRQEHDVALAKQEVEPVLRKKYNEDIDEMIKIELENMKLLSGVKAKKGKKKKGKKKGKKKKGPKMPPGFKLIKNRHHQDLLVDLIDNNIVKKLPP